MEPESVTTKGPMNLKFATRNEIAEALASIATMAGPAIMAIYEQDPAVRSKSDGSPVTDADERAEAIIHAGLRALFPDTPVIAEEAVAAGADLTIADEFFLVDPLDGTREFLKRNGEFTVNVALVRSGVPVAGAVYAPAVGRLWFGGDRAWKCVVKSGDGLPAAEARLPLKSRTAPDQLIALASRSHRDPETEAFLMKLPVEDVTSAGSSLKFCVIAEGQADVYPRFGPTMEWDTAAGDAVLRAAGGVVLCEDGAPFEYGKWSAALKNGAFIAWGDPEAAKRFR